MLWLSYAILNSVRKRGSASSTGSCSRNDDTAGAMCHTASSSLPSMTGGCAARVATAVLLLLLSLVVGGADCCAWIAASGAAAIQMTSHAQMADSGPKLPAGADSNTRTN